MIETAERFAEEDEANRKRVEAKNRLEEYCSAIKQLVHDTTSWYVNVGGQLHAMPEPHAKLLRRSDKPCLPR